MKKIIFLFLLGIQNSNFAQVDSILYLDQNNVSATINSTSTFFNDYYNNISGYEFPKGEQTRLIYCLAFWYGGLDSNDSLHLAGTRFATINDFYCGPIANHYNNHYTQKYDNKIWMVSKNEILYHITSHNFPGYVMPEVIETWPGNGNISNGESQQLAPYVDVNHNNVYDPENGDYPKIRGDKAAYFIANDDAGPHLETGGKKLKMEFHYMFYQYSSNDFRNNTTFINLKIINKSNNTYHNFKSSIYCDHDIGGSSDDFMGCSPDHNLMIGYNGDAIDDGQGGSTYGENPPVLGIKFLNHSMTNFAYFNNSGGPIGDPINSEEYWGYMNSYWGNSGVHFTEGGSGFGGTVETDYMYPGNPTDTSSWNEIGENNPPADRRMLGTTEAYTIGPNQSICFDYAVLASGDGDSVLQNISNLFAICDSVQYFFDNENYFDCFNTALDINQESISNINVFPNPNNGSFKINLKEAYEVNIYNEIGKLVYSEKVKDFSSNNLIETELSHGLYFILVTTKSNQYSSKIIIN